MAYKKIEHYGIIGNGFTVALVGCDGSIDWLCMPYMDSPSVFAAILDDAGGGRFSVKPVGDWDSVQRYLPRTNILQTRFRNPGGEVELLDSMPAGPSVENDSLAKGMVNRCLKGISGELVMQVEFMPRFQYGAKIPLWNQHAGNRWLLADDDESIGLYISCKVESVEDGKFSFRLAEGQTVWISAFYGQPDGNPDDGYLAGLFEDTKSYWLEWVRAQETGKYPDLGLWQESLDRSALVLKLLQFEATGAIAAAASCSLPTIIYGERNWDYRFSWVRDTSMTLQALFELGHTREVSMYLAWLKELGRHGENIDLDILYKLREPAPPTGEEILEHLDGYKGSRPVHIGQYNVGQHQHDIYGELLDMIFSMSRLVGKIDPDYWRFVRRLVDKVVDIWRDKDNGIWELRTGPHHTTHSKMMCWVALDRGIKIAEHYGFPADLDKWQEERDLVRRDILEKAYNNEKKTFTQHYDTGEVDAALLQMPLVGFLPADDPRMIDTIKCIEKELMVGGIPLRYKADDGLPGQEPGWLICLFWYLRCLIRQGRLDEVEARLRQVSRYANHLGLFGEEYDTQYNEITGNFPQAFSHIGYTMTVLEYLDSRRPRKVHPPMSIREKVSMLMHSRNLTPDVPETEVKKIDAPGLEIKKIMNILRGQYYDGHRQRVDYRRISESEYYQDFEKGVAALRYFDPGVLENDRARMAFWINVFNTLVIHGVIALKIRDSVKEVPFFFERVKYTIGERVYSLSDIEHGILRGNRTPPYRIKRRFTEEDPRQDYCIHEPDPRVHFSLVCASRTCPPIEAYIEEQLDAQLDTSASVFINATSQLAKHRKELTVSKIFQWYREDFQCSPPELIRFIGRYLYDREQGKWVEDQAETLQLQYTPYDWRLNR